MGLLTYLPHSLLGLVLVGVGLTSCDEDSKTKSNNDKKAPAAAGQASTGTNGNAADGSATEPAAGFYLGFDGKNDYSILLSQGRNYTIKDTSVATIKKETVKLSTDTIDELIADARKSNSDLDSNAENSLRQLLGCEQTAYRIVPLKVGKTTVSGAQQNNNSQDRFGQSSNFSLVVSSYTQAQYDAGKVRYTTEGAGNLKACKSCHETGAEGAPPHELGAVMQLSDSQFIQWVTTGKVAGRVAKINHTWEFSNDSQKQGVVAYLRAKASKDIETFTKLVFEERFAEFKDGQARLPGIGGGPGRRGTSTGTGSTPTFRCPGNGVRGAGPRP